ncbi:MULTISPECIES: methyltransferase [unclassified Leifsonia]|uniref:methyltransferase n=1 Tax=unclassified Leifsonia TaxID=2663824 RepID=UPI0008A7C92A|nr:MULTISPECIES: methyltransferase [unclassified Leifsonia]SEH84934.1 3-oxo-5-alpha-steroid 4-dehydrogenase 1 [Leifsonia sp. CL154]SFL47503.1 3-oxo-5-alpha-steroid 4-dehydrogenase 1 [Leifsonia sp. CL147]
MPEGAYRWFVYAELALALVTFVALLFVVAPYGGRHGRVGWGPTVPARVGWIVMEAPAPVLFVAFFLLGSRRAQLVPLVFLALWLVHYVYRAFVYPFLMRSGSRMPVLVMALAIAFNTLNAWVNARWISEYGSYPVAWVADPRFWIGVALFAGGLTLNARSDRTLRRLRRAGGGYRIPNGGGFRYVSSPNYLGEMIEWTGWAIATWSLAGTAFALYTIANLGPRAVANHRWYRSTFPDYPPERRALLPFVL